MPKCRWRLKVNNLSKAYPPPGCVWRKKLSRCLWRGSKDATNCGAVSLYFKVRSTHVFRDLGVVKSASTMYSRFKDLVLGNSTCPLCKRGFEDEKALADFITSVGFFFFFFVSGCFLIFLTDDPSWIPPSVPTCLNGRPNTRPESPRLKQILPSDDWLWLVSSHTELRSWNQMSAILSILSLLLIRHARRFKWQFNKQRPQPKHWKRFDLAKLFVILQTELENGAAVSELQILRELQADCDHVQRLLTEIAALKQEISALESKFSGNFTFVGFCLVTSFQELTPPLHLKKKRMSCVEWLKKCLTKYHT